MKVFLFHFYNAIANPAYSQIAKAMRKDGNQVAVGYRNTDDDLTLDFGDPTKQAMIAGPQKSSLKGPLAALQDKFFFLMFILRVRAFICAWRPDAVQVNRANVSWFWLIPLMMPAPIKFLLDCRQVSVKMRAQNPVRALRQDLRGVLHRFYIRHLFDRATYLHERGAIKELGPKWSSHATVIPLGVGETFSHCHLQQHEPGRILHFLYIGSITRIRKLDLLIEAAVLQKKISGANFRLVFAGPDNTGGYYQALGKKLGVDDVVSFIPPTPYEQMPEVIYAHDVALAYVPDEPQDWVYQPTLKILEYQALGVPVLATAVPPNVDIIEASANGVVVNNTAEEWQKGMNRYITDRAFLETTRKNARENRKAHSWDEVASLYCDLYRSL